MHAGRGGLAGSSPEREGQEGSPGAWRVESSIAEGSGGVGRKLGRRRPSSRVPAAYTGERGGTVTMTPAASRGTGARKGAGGAAPFKLV
jgi:hypothetical protein